MSVIENIKKAISLLEENENYYQELFELQSQTDKKIDYWLHYIELEKVPVTQSYKIIKELKRLRNLRRQYKNEMALMRVFKDNEQKLCNISNRKILLNQICRTDNKQQNAKYSYDAYTSEVIEKILGGIE